MSGRWTYLACVGAAALFLSTVAQAVHDITGPRDVVVGVPDDGDWPGAETPPMAVDDQVNTKYLHFKGDFYPNVGPTGFKVTPACGPSVVTGMTFTSANDCEGRDPIEVELAGSDATLYGSYTVIARVPIEDFAGAVPWPRNTKTKTPIRFSNAIPYKHYQVLFTKLRTSTDTCYDSVQIAEVELLADTLTATTPNPADGATGVSLPLLQWTPGDTAVFEDVYVGTIPNLTASHRIVEQQPAAMPIAYYAGPWKPGQTFYWRVDDIEATGRTRTGDVWSFTFVPMFAHSPHPRDGDKWIDPDTDLSWRPAWEAMTHKLYFGADPAAVALRDPNVFMGSSYDTKFVLPRLAPQTTYYWVVDEVGWAEHPGYVWSFTTAGGGGGIRGDYFPGLTPGGAPRLTRIDPKIDFRWGAGGPGSGIGPDRWSARWTADLEIAVKDTFTFTVTTQDGVRLWVNGDLIIDHWVDMATTTFSSLPMPLERGLYPLRMEWYDNTGEAVAQLYWQTPTSPRQIIPAGPLQPPCLAHAVYPRKGEVNVAQDVRLRWLAGGKATGHDVYFGDNKDAVARATTASTGTYKGRQALGATSFQPGPLQWNKNCYWRIDEVNDTSPKSPWKGDVWAFTTANFLVIDDMENYTDEEGLGNRVYETWIDGFDTGRNGSMVGYEVAPFAEQTIVHGGTQSMPLTYNNVVPPYYSEAFREFTPVQDWTVDGGTDLSLWVRGHPAHASIPVTETAGGRIALTGGGADIWNNCDEFAFAYKYLLGSGGIRARVISNGNGTNAWAKGGVMIRDYLGCNSKFADMIMTGGAGNGASFQYRVSTGESCGNKDSATPVAPPYWVKLERDGNAITGYLSANGSDWVPQGIETIVMSGPVHIGLCVTSHAGGEQRTFEFDSIATSGLVSGPWRGVIVTGQTTNSMQPMYVAIEDSHRNRHSEPVIGGIITTNWIESRIPLSKFASSVNLTKVRMLYIGVGSPTNPSKDGTGRVYVDDIQIVRP